MEDSLNDDSQEFPSRPPLLSVVEEEEAPPIDQSNEQDEMGNGRQQRRQQRGHRRRTNNPRSKKSPSTSFISTTTTISTTGYFLTCGKLTVAFILFASAVGVGCAAWYTLRQSETTDYNQAWQAQAQTLLTQTEQAVIDQTARETLQQFAVTIASLGKMMMMIGPSSESKADVSSVLIWPNVTVPVRFQQRHNHPSTLLLL